MKKVNLKIDGLDVQAPKGSTILEAARLVNIEIPTICFLKDINEIGACRMCVVEVKGAKNLTTACVYPVSEGMEVWTNTPKVLSSRKKTLELLLSDHDRKCLSCVRSGKCELQELCHEYKVDDVSIFEGEKNTFPLDTSADHMVRDNNKCILCRRCIASCGYTQGIGVIGANERGFKTNVGSAFGMGLGDTSCVCCGQCIKSCPTGAIYEKDNTDDVIQAIADPDKFVIVQAAPAVRAALGEMFEYPIGTDVQGKLAAALRRLGFNKVFDTDFGADLTIVEEANEFVERLQNGGTLPMITSCSPGWVKYCEHYYPDQIGHLSSCKSPQQMFGAVAKSYYAEKMGIDKENMVVVSVMPCTAKKFEINRDNEDANGVPDVDIVITTRELGRMIEQAGIKFRQLPKEKFDDPLGISTGAGVIFGATGGVMEAALRTAVETLTGEELKELNFTEVRGTSRLKEASYNIAGREVKVAVASGLKHARRVMDMVKSGEADYDFIEIMCCPGGCVNGGGQPQQPGYVRNTVKIRKKRADVLYRLDKKSQIRKSHENPAIIELYDTYLDKPGSERAHELLHTTYVQRVVNRDF